MFTARLLHCYGIDCVVNFILSQFLTLFITLPKTSVQLFSRMSLKRDHVKQTIA